MFAVDDIEDVLARLHTHSAEFVGELQTRTAIRSVPSANPRLTAVVGPEPGSDPFAPALPAE